jgi:hypothetical protein
MDTDLGLTGFGLLLALSLIFGLVVRLVPGRGTRWEWLIGATAFLLGGLFVSEVMFAGVTEEVLQPVIDGLAFDEAMLGGLLIGVLVVIATRFLSHGRPFSRTVSV